MSSNKGHSNKGGGSISYQKEREGTLQVQEGCFRLPENNRGKDRHRRQVNQAKQSSSQRVPLRRRESRNPSENVNIVVPAKTHTLVCPSQEPQAPQASNPFVVLGEAVIPPTGDNCRQESTLSFCLTRSTVFGSHFKERSVV